MSARQLRARLDRLTLSARTAVGQDRTAITGDPNASVDLLRQALETVIGEGEFIRALREPAEKLLEETEKLKPRHAVLPREARACASARASAEGRGQFHEGRGANPARHRGEHAGAPADEAARGTRRQRQGDRARRP